MMKLKERIKFNNTIGVPYIYKGVQYVISTHHTTPQPPFWGTWEIVDMTSEHIERIVAVRCTDELPEVVKILEGTEVVDFGHVDKSLVQNVKEVQLPDTVQWLTHKSFEDWRSLEKISPLKWCGVPPGAFKQSNLQEVHADECDFANSIFAGTPIKKATIENSNLFMECFKDCAELQTVTLNNCRTYKSNGNFEKLAAIPPGMFEDCSSLTDAHINPPLQILTPRAFECCNSLERLDTSECISVAYKALWGCTSLKEVNLKACRKLDMYAMCNCSSLTKLDLSSCLEIDTGALSGCSSLKFLNIEKVSAAKEFDHCDALEYLVCPRDYPNTDLLKSLKHLKVVFLTNTTTVNMLKAIYLTLPQSVKLVASKKAPMLKYLKELQSRSYREVELVDDLSGYINQIYRNI